MRGALLDFGFIEGIVQHEKAWCCKFDVMHEKIEFKQRSIAWRAPDKRMRGKES